MEQTGLVETFQFSRSTKGIVLFGLILFTLGLFGSVALLFYVAKKILWVWILVILGYIFFTVVFVRIWRTRNNVITVEHAGIGIHGPNSPNRFIRWEDISELTEHNILGKLSVKNRNDEGITIDYGVSRMNLLLTSLINHIPRLVAGYALLNRFHRTLHLRVFFLGALAFTSGLVVLCWERYPLLSVLFLVFSASIVFVLLTEFTRVEVGERTIKMIFPLWSRTIQLSQIRDTEIKCITETNGKIIIAVLLNLRGGKTIKIGDVREGTIPLYTSIKHKIKHFTS